MDDMASVRVTVIGRDYQLADTLERSGFKVTLVGRLNVGVVKETADIVVIDGKDSADSAVEQLLIELRRAIPMQVLPILVAVEQEDSNSVVRFLQAGANDIIHAGWESKLLRARFQSQLRAVPKNNGAASAPASAPRSASSLALVPGDVLGHYRLDSVVGIGGMGVVYKATDTLLDRVVAIKVLPDDVAMNARHLARFRREGEIMARVNHPQVVRILDIGDEPANYLVMEYIQGQDIDDILQSGLYSPRKAAELIRQVALVLAEVHNAQIVHRDLKPGNLIVDEAGIVHVLDFGISKLVDAEVALTRPGSTMGTPAYMAPEQLDDKLGPIDGRTDIYSLGLILYELVAGNVPFRSEGFFNMVKEILVGSPMSLRAVNKDVHPLLDKVVLKATSRQADKRYVNMTELAEALAEYLTSTTD